MIGATGVVRGNIEHLREVSDQYLRLHIYSIWGMSHPGNFSGINAHFKKPVAQHNLLMM